MTNEPELDTELVRSIYSIAISDRTGGPVSERMDSHHDAGQEFDTWLAAHDAEVAAKTWEEGYSRGFYDRELMAGASRDASEGASLNPYVSDLVQP